MDQAVPLLLSVGIVASSATVLEESSLQGAERLRLKPKQKRLAQTLAGFRHQPSTTMGFEKLAIASLQERTKQMNPNVLPIAAGLFL